VKAIESKIHTFETIRKKVLHWKKEKHQIVFTNGCFDLIHFGHLAYLSEAAGLGNRFIIGLNSDASISRLKGTHRPIKDLKTRQYLLASFQFVDAVVVFEEDTPYELIKIIEPHILVKGGDWQLENIVGADIVLANRGQVKSLPFVDGYSTTNIEQKIKKQR